MHQITTAYTLADRARLAPFQADRLIQDPSGVAKLDRRTLVSFVRYLNTFQPEQVARARAAAEARYDSLSHKALGALRRNLRRSK